MAMCVMAVEAVAACQCFSPAESRSRHRAEFLDRAAPTLREAAARRHDKGLAQRMGVPRGPGSGLERDTRAGHTRRIGGLEERVDAHRAGEILASISIPSATGHSLQVFRVPSP
jgi:hypothetical protein